jgi:hypothetical protein
MSGLLGFPAPVSYSAGQPSPFDIAAINAEIDRKLASLRPEDTGRVTLQVKDGNFGAGLIIRVPELGKLKPFVLGEVSRPRAGRFSWALTGGVSFLKAEDPKPVRVAPVLRGLYRLFRKRGSNPVVAAIKAVRLNGGAEVRIG